jgi:hypothetical protein
MQRLRTRLFWLLGCALLVSNPALAFAAGQTVKTPSKQQAKPKAAPPDPETQAIVDAAFSVPPEFGADALIQLAASPRAHDPRLKSELLEKAFDLAAEAQEPVKLVAVTRQVDSRSGSIGRAYSMDLDELSLKARVIQAMLILNPLKARALAERTQLPSLEPLDCSSPLVYDLHLFYVTIAQVARQGFTPEEKRKGAQLTFLMPYVTSFQSHAQVAPAADMLQSAGLSPLDMEQLSNLFAGALAQLGGDPRSFAASVDSTRAIRNLLGARGVMSSAILTALRGYLVSNYSGERCGEIADPVMPNAVEFFNEHYAALLLGFRLSSIDQNEIANFRTGPSALVIPYWQSAEATQLLQEVRRLKFREGDDILSVSDRTTSEWTTSEVDFLTHLEAWEPGSEPSEADFFDEKSILYQGLINLLPTESERSKVLARYANFLEQTSAQNIDPIEWFYPVHLLFVRCGEAHDCPQVIDALVNSHNPTLNLYGKLERDILPIRSGPAIVQ